MNTKLTKIAAVAAAGVALAIGSVPASAFERVGLGVNIGVPVYAPAYPAYGYAPYGCAYGDPYYPCAPAYYGYGGPYVGFGYYGGWGHGWDHDHGGHGGWGHGGGGGGHGGGHGHH